MWRNGKDKADDDRNRSSKSSRSWPRQMKEDESRRINRLVYRVQQYMRTKSKDR